MSIHALPVSIEVADRAKLSLGLLFGAVGLVMRIACAKLASLLLARGADQGNGSQTRLGGFPRTNLAADSNRMHGPGIAGERHRLGLAKLDDPIFGS